MQVKKHADSSTQATMTVVADAKELAGIKKHVLTHFQGKVKVPGFRAGKIPTEVLEKHVDSTALQAEFLEEAINELLTAGIKQLELRPVGQPQISIQKFVPFTTLEFEAKLEVLGDIKLADYKKIKLAKPEAKITAADVKEVIESLRQRMADKKDVDRAAKEGDQIWIDFKGVDAKTKDPIKGADGQDYPLVLGSNTFIPGFEPELVGQKAGDTKTFTLTFPKDYGVKALASKKVTFTVDTSKVQEVVLPKADDDFAKKAGPFKSLDHLKADIKTQMGQEKQYKVDRDYESELVKTISEKSTVDIPESLIEDQIERLLNDVRQNLLYRGQTMQEMLDQEGKTEEEYRKQVLRPEAESRVKAGLVLAEISDKENLSITPEEIDQRMAELKTQYKDEQMQAELAKPEARRDIAARMLTEKTVNTLVAYAA